MNPRRREARAGLGREIDYAALADLRYQIRRFLRQRELAARAAGIEPQQYLVLLQVKGLERRGAVTIGVLAERLQIRHHAAVQLVDRLAAQDMVERGRDKDDGRVVVVRLRPAGESVLRRLALYSIAELETEGPALLSFLRRLVGAALRQIRRSNGKGLAGRVMRHRPRSLAIGRSEQRVRGERSIRRAPED
jgi:DNA-binding MarR family transcriptional regulator